MQILFRSTQTKNYDTNMYSIPEIYKFYILRVPLALELGKKCISFLLTFKSLFILLTAQRPKIEKDRTRNHLFCVTRNYLGYLWHGYGGNCNYRLMENE